MNQTLKLVGESRRLLAVLPGWASGRAFLFRAVGFSACPFFYPEDPLLGITRK